MTETREITILFQGYRFRLAENLKLNLIHVEVREASPDLLVIDRNVLGKSFMTFTLLDLQTLATELIG